MANEPEPVNTDLGLGARVIEENKTRFLNRDGTFNVRRKGVLERGAFSPYHAVLNMSWPRFYTIMLGAYLLVNTTFTLLYLLAGMHAFPAIASGSIGGRFGELFFYSIQILTTIGASPLQPATFFAKFVISLEALSGLLGFALGAGLIMARFSNPAVRIIFSEKAVISPYKDITGFMVRTINGRSNELIEAAVTVTLAMADKNGRRTFQQLSLERDRVLVFPLNWTIVHPITKESPLYGLGAKDLTERNAEFLIAISAVDQDLSKKVYARHSYVGSEVAVGAKFVNIIERTDDGTVIVDPSRIHEIEGMQ